MDNPVFSSCANLILTSIDLSVGKYTLCSPIPVLQKENTVHAFCWNSTRSFSYLCYKFHIPKKVASIRTYVYVNICSAIDASHFILGLCFVNMSMYLQRKNIKRLVMTKANSANSSDLVRDLKHDTNTLWAVLTGLPRLVDLHPVCNHSRRNLNQAVFFVDLANFLQAPEFPHTVLSKMPDYWLPAYFEWKNRNTYKVYTANNNIICFLT